MTIYFPPDDKRPQHVAEVGQQMGGRLALPREVLERHGARELVPAAAARPARQPLPAPTVYRHGVLLVPERLLRAQPAVDAIRVALREVGMSFDVPAPLADLKEFARYAELAADDSGADTRRRFWQRRRATPAKTPADDLAQIPRRVRLQASTQAPTVVDAWVALQAIRAGLGGAADLLRGGGKLRYVDVADAISLEHLLVGAAVVTGGPGPTEGSGTGQGPGIASYLQVGYGGRAPVEVLAELPPRRAPGGPRPVVAVLDTGIEQNRWLGIPKRRQLPAADGYLQVDPAMQEAVLRLERDDSTAAGVSELIETVWDRPVTSQPLIGEMDTHTGHGIFIAGIFRQLAPDARVLAIRIMHSDGIVYEGDLRLVLRLLAARARQARAGKTGRSGGWVDAVSLSLGYYDEGAADAAYTAGLAADIDALTAQGILVVAAAGNQATDRRFLPAALAGRRPAGQARRLIAVGALNPNSSTALFSNDGNWVTCWASGAAVVSTFPEVVGSRTPVDMVGDRESLDIDDFRSGWALWSGTSFAAPLVGAAILDTMVKNGEHDKKLSLDDIGDDATIRRLTKAVSDVRTHSAERPSLGRRDNGGPG